MKNLILIFFLLCFYLPGNSQDEIAKENRVLYIDFPEKVMLKTFVWDHTPEQDRPVADLLVVRKQFSVFQTGTGQFYVKYKNIFGLTSRRYLGWPTGNKYDDMSVFTNSDRTKFWIIQINSRDIPYRIRLPNHLFIE